MTWEGRSLTLSALRRPRPQGSTSAGVRTAPAAQGCALLANMVALGFVFGLVLSLLLPADASAGEAAGLGSGRPLSVRPPMRTLSCSVGRPPSPLL